MKKDYSEIFEEHSLRFDKLIWLPSAIVMDAESEDFRTFCEDDFPEANSRLFKYLPILKKFADGEENPRVDDIAETLAMARKTGFLAEVSRPVMKAQGAGIYDFSWGYTRVVWMYGDTLDELVGHAVAWAIEQRDKEAKALNAKVP